MCIQWNIFEPQKEGNSGFCDNTDGTWGSYAKRNKLDRGKQILYDLAYMWDSKKNKMTLRNRKDWWLPDAEGWGVGLMGKSGKKVQTFTY